MNIEVHKCTKGDDNISKRLPRAALVDNSLSLYIKYHAGQMISTVNKPKILRVVLVNLMSAYAKFEHGKI